MESFDKTIPSETVRKALAITYICVTWLGMFGLLITESGKFFDVVFETVSALGTIGLSQGLTAELSNPGKLVIMLLMFTGRLGPLTVAYCLTSPRVKATRFPSSRLAIG